MNDEIISPEQAWEKIQAGAIILDVRSEAEVKDGKLPGAVVIPHTEVMNRVSELGDNREREVVVYCAVGGRASMAKQDLVEQGFHKVFNAGGFSDLESYAKEKGLL